MKSKQMNRKVIRKEGRKKDWKKGLEGRLWFCSSLRLFAACLNMVS